MNHDELIRSLAQALSGRVLFLGVGNRLRGDDGAGPLVIDAAQGNVDAVCIDAGDTPENFLGKVIEYKPDTLALIDAVNFGGVPGEVRLFAPEELDENMLFTHGMSLKMACDYLKASLPLRIFLIGIMPKSIALGDEVSAPVHEAVALLSAALKEMRPRA